MQFRKTKLVLLPGILVLLSLAFRFIVYAHQPLQVTATVPPQASDFQFDFAATSAQTNVNQNQTLTYQITYGAKPSAGQTTTLTITADYSHDTSGGIDVLDYVAGSATKGYGNATPVINLVDRTIQWTISLPEGVTDQTVSFSLQTNSDFTENTSVPFTVTSSARTPFFSLGQLSDSKTYTFDPGLVTPTPTLTPTITPTPTPQPVKPQPGTVTPTLTPTTQVTMTPIPTLSQPATRITNISITTISQTDIGFDVITSVPTTLLLRYGTTPTALSQTSTTTDRTIEQTITMTHLIPDTTYYVQLFADGTASDLLVVHTASKQAIQEVALQTLLFTSNGILLSTPQLLDGTNHSAIIVLPTNSDFEVNFALSQAIPIRSIFASIKRQSVLGINTFSSFYNDETMIPIVEKQPDIFRLKLTAPQANGIYAITLKIHDANGNITNQPLAMLKVISPLLIVDQQNNQPIKEARVFLSRYNYLTKRFAMLPPYDGNTQNPVFSNAAGIVPLVLPQGHYKITVSAYGYEDVTHTFTIGNKPGEEFPSIALHNNLWSRQTITNFFRTNWFDAKTNIMIFAKLISASHELFVFINLLLLFFTCSVLMLWFVQKVIAKLSTSLYILIKIFTILITIGLSNILLLLSVFATTWGIVTVLPSLVLCLVNLVLLTLRVL